MPNYKADVYINDIYVKTYFAELDNEDEAFDHLSEVVREDLFLDIEEIED